MEKTDGVITLFTHRHSAEPSAKKRPKLEGDVSFKVASGVVRACRFLGDGRRQIDVFHASISIPNLAARRW
jgi:hypothetical protein